MKKYFILTSIALIVFFTCYALYNSMYLVWIGNKEYSYFGKDTETLSHDEAKDIIVGYNPDNTYKKTISYNLIVKPRFLFAPVKRKEIISVTYNH